VSDRWSRTVHALALFQLGDALACAIPLHYIRKDWDAIRCPPAIRQAIPPIKVASAAGLVLGRRWPTLGRITAMALVVYFAAAIGFHVRAKDPVWKSAPAAALLALSGAIARRGFNTAA